MSGLGINWGGIDEPINLWSDKPYMGFGQTSSSASSSRAIDKPHWSHGAPLAESAGRSSHTSVSSGFRGVQQAEDTDDLPLQRYEERPHRASDVTEDDIVSPIYVTSRARGGSDDSQTSYGPVTPGDTDLYTVSQTRAPPLPIIFDTHLSTPRKAPSPPPKERDSRVGSPLLNRRPSFTQSMMRTLSGRKKDVAIPPPLNLPPVPLIPANIEIAPIVHHVSLPAALAAQHRRNGSKSYRNGLASPVMPITPVKYTAQTRRSSDHERRDSSAWSRASISSVFKSIRKSISTGDSRKNSAASVHSASNGHIRFAVPSTAASKISEDSKGSTSSTLSSPMMRQARKVPSKSWDAGATMSRVAGLSKSSSRSLGRSPPGSPGRLRTAPADRTSFQKVHSSPLRDSFISSPMPSIAVTPALFEIDYSNPWKTYKPNSSFVSDIPVSPGQTLMNHRPNMHRQDSRSDASLYKQSVLEQKRSSGLQGQNMAVAPSPDSSRYEDADEGQRGLTKYRISSIAPVLPAPEFPSAISLDDHPSKRHDDWSGLLSPSQPGPLTVDNGSTTSLDRVAEQQSAPHLYIDTIGSMSLRNPFASTSSSSAPYDIPAEPTSAIPTSSSRRKDEPRRSSKKGSKLQEKRASEPAAVVSSASRQRRHNRGGSDASIEFAFVRRRTEPTIERRGTMQGELIWNPAVTPSSTSSPRSPPPDTPIIRTTQPASKAGVVSPVLSQDGEREGSIAQLLASPSNISDFRNPFLARLSVSRYDDRVPLPSPPSDGEHLRGKRSFSYSSATGHRAGPIEASSAAPAYSRGPSFLAEGDPSWQPPRMSRTSEASLRRPSVASYASSLSFPTKPTRVETKRQNHLAGLRVSIDSQLM